MLVKSTTCLSLSSRCSSFLKNQRKRNFFFVFVQLCASVCVYVYVRKCVCAFDSIPSHASNRLKTSCRRRRDREIWRIRISALSQQLILIVPSHARKHSSQNLRTKSFITFFFVEQLLLSVWSTRVCQNLLTSTSKERLKSVPLGALLSLTLFSPTSGEYNHPCLYVVTGPKS